MLEIAPETPAFAQFTMASANTTLDEHIQALPQELQDSILHFFLDAETEPTRTFPATIELVLRTASPKDVQPGTTLAPSPNDGCPSMTVTPLWRPRYNNQSKYRPPLGLQLNRTNRTKFARRYYADRIFRVFGRHDLRLWLQSLTKEHRDMVTVMWNGFEEEGGLFGLSAMSLTESRVKPKLAALDVKAHLGITDLLLGDNQFICMVHVRSFNPEARCRYVRRECYRLDGDHYLWD